MIKKKSLQKLQKFPKIVYLQIEVGHESVGINMPVGFQFFREFFGQQLMMLPRHISQHIFHGQLKMFVFFLICGRFADFHFVLRKFAGSGRSVGDIFRSLLVGILNQGFEGIFNDRVQNTHLKMRNLIAYKIHQL